jgi:hypothetical protein
VRRNDQRARSRGRASLSRCGPFEVAIRQAGSSAASARQHDADALVLDSHPARRETEARSPRRASAGRCPQTSPTQLLLSRCSALRVPRKDGFLYSDPPGDQAGDRLPKSIPPLRLMSCLGPGAGVALIAPRGRRVESGQLQAASQRAASRKARPQVKAAAGAGRGDIGTRASRQEEARSLAFGGLHARLQKHEALIALPRRLGLQAPLSEAP